MDSLKHTTTFLRSALVNDPFCLGDLGPEDVLRIESEFPDLFDECISEHRCDKRNNCEKTKGKPSPKKVEANNRVVESSSFSPTKGLQLRPRPSPYLNLPLHLPPETNSVCSRGDRCGCAVSRTPPVPYTKSLNKFPLRKAQVPPNTAKLPIPLAASQIKPSSPCHRPNTTESASAKPRRKVTVSRKSNPMPTSASLILSPTPNIRRAIQTNLARKSDSEMLKSRQLTSTPTKPNSKLTKLDKFDPQMVIVHSIQKGSKVLVPKSALDSKIRENSRKNTKGQQVPLLSNRILHIENQGLVIPENERNIAKKLQEKTTQHHLPPSDLDMSSSCSSTCSDYSYRDSEDCAITRKIKFRNASHVSDVTQNQINRQSPSEKQLLQTMRHPMEKEDEVSRIEQLELARRLVAKYEKEGKFRKREESLIPEDHNGHEEKIIVSKRNEPNTYSNVSKSPKVSIPILPKTSSLIEQVAQELVRAEILKCIHDEVVHRKVDAAVETESHLFTLEISQYSENHAAVQSKESKDKDNLSTIDEESVVLITPELTPPEDPQNRFRINSHPRPNCNNFNVDSNIRTPEVTPPSKSQKLKKNTNQSRIRPNTSLNNNTSNDITDCSSISDFIFSEIEQPLIRNNERKFTKENSIELPTPSKSESSIASKIIECLSDMVSLSTPARSSNESKHVKHPSQEANIVGDFVDKPTQTEHGHVRKSRSKSSVSRVLSDLDISATKSPSKYLYINEFVSEGEFLLTPYKSNGEVSISMSPGLYLSQQENDDTDNDVTEYGGLSKVYEIGIMDEEEITEHSISEGEIATSALLSKVEHLLNNSHITDAHR